MAKSKVTKQDAIASADELRELTASEIKALPGMLGFLASAHILTAGRDFYGFTDTATGRKVLIVLK